jgi:hypothetical protein
VPKVLFGALNGSTNSWSDLTVTGTNNGIATLSPAADISLGNQGNLTNNGTMTISGAFQINNGAEGTIPTLTNNGILNVNIPPGTSGAPGTVVVNVSFANAGTFNAQRGLAVFALPVAQTAGSTNLLVPFSADNFPILVP